MLYKQLIVWQKAMDLVEIVYDVKLPEEEKFNLLSQIKRSAVSIPSNIAEGNGRNSNKEFVRFLQIAKGSLFELQTQIEICIRLHYIKYEKYKKIIDLSQEIEAMIMGLIKKLNS